MHVPGGPASRGLRGHGHGACRLGGGGQLVAGRASPSRPKRLCSKYLPPCDPLAGGHRCITRGPGHRHHHPRTGTPQAKGTRAPRVGGDWRGRNRLVHEPLSPLHTLAFFFAAHVGWASLPACLVVARGAPGILARGRGHPRVCGLWGRMAPLSHFAHDASAASCTRFDHTREPHTA